MSTVWREGEQPRWHYDFEGDGSLSFLVLCNGLWRKVPNLLWTSLEGFDEVPRGFVNDGCTASPDAIREREVWPACVIHDFDYSAQGTVTRRHADARFRRNLIRCHMWYGADRVRAWGWALVYWRFVRRLGWKFFRKRPGEIVRG